MFISHTENNHAVFEDCPSSPLGRKATSALNQDSYSTPKSKYKSVEKHAHELINTPKPSSKKKSILSHLENTLELPSFDDDIPNNHLSINLHKQLSTIQENFEDDKENNQNYYNQYNYHFRAPEKNIKKQIFQSEFVNQLEDQFQAQMNNVFSSLNSNDLGISNTNGHSNLMQNMCQQNKLVDFFYMFNEKNERIQSLFDTSAQFEIINSGFNTSVTENIIQLNQNFSRFQIDSNSIQFEQQQDAIIINLRGTGFGYSNNCFNLIASAKINYNNNLISHIRIQFI
ncbi:hypothetical protein ABPG74_016313 [Tetrahymena malaccensis]